MSREQFNSILFGFQSAAGIRPPAARFRFVPFLQQSAEIKCRRPKSQHPCIARRECRLYNLAWEVKHPEPSEAGICGL
jgi:hypothetical protein